MRRVVSSGNVVGDADTGTLCAYARERWQRSEVNRSIAHSCSTRSRRSRPVSAPVLVRLGAARLDSDAPPPSSADTARRLTHLRHCRPTAAAMFGVYALPHGIVFCHAELGGIGSPIKQPAVPGAALKWYDRL